MLSQRLLLAFRQALRRRVSSTRNSTTSSARFSFRSPIHEAPSRYAFSTLQARPNARIAWQTVWKRGQERRYRRQTYSYQRFTSPLGLLQKWAARRTFYYEVGGITGACATFYVVNLEPVPVSGRRRFNLISPESEVKMAQATYRQTLQEFGNKLMPAYSKEHRMVQRVLNRLLPHSGLEGEKWEVHVINDNMKNAFVIPGGKVFVFRGILDICQGDDGLAAVLGHEIAHNVAHHAAERMSQSFILAPVALIADLIVLSTLGINLGLGSGLSRLVFQLPGSRKQEEEADYIGLLMMAESCYDPSAAMGLWARMEGEEKGQAVPPQFLSTHPSSHNRLEKISGWLPKALEKWETGDCGPVAGYAQQFSRGVAELGRW